jgi:hypothetical protein
MFISFAPPKEMNQRKGGRKRQPHPVCPPATQSLKGATKQGAVRTFSGFPMRIPWFKLWQTGENDFVYWKYLFYFAFQSTFNISLWRVNQTISKI